MTHTIYEAGQLECRQVFSALPYGQGEYKYAIECLQREGWQRGRLYDNRAYLEHQLPDMQKEGRCGLIAETYVEVSCTD